MHGSNKSEFLVKVKWVIVTNGPLVQCEKFYIYNIECKGSILHKSFMRVNFSIPLIINIIK